MVSQTDPEHPSDESLLALIHEQPSDDGAAIRAHLTACDACAARSRVLTEHDATIATLLQALDHPLPAARATFAARHSPLLRRAALVAGSAVTLAAAAAAVVPGSPLRRWYATRTTSTAAVRPDSSAAPAAIAPAAVPDAPPASGIAIPAAPTLVVMFRQEQASGVVELVRTTSGDVTFRSRGGAAAYDVADGRVTIDNQAPAEAYVIQMPASVRQVRIRVGSRTLLRWPEDSARFALPDDALRARVRFDIAATKVP